MSNYTPGTGRINTSTPGPWKAVPKGEIYRGWHVVAADPELQDLPVAEIWSTAYDEDKNARLIAAAPDLKDKLEELITIVEMTDLGKLLHTEILLAWNLIHAIDTGVDHVSDCINGPSATQTASGKDRE